MVPEVDGAVLDLVVVDLVVVVLVVVVVVCIGVVVIDVAAMVRGVGGEGEEGDELFMGG